VMGPPERSLETDMWHLMQASIRAPSLGPTLETKI